jgi:AcrR family transcriptional regulator
MTVATAKQGGTTRVDRRRERTRAALIGAAQRFLAEGRTNVSIQDITDSADVGFGTFYNHFETKEQLFTEAVDAALDAYSELRDTAVEGIADPAAVFASSFRMTGRLQRRFPELVRVILHSGTGILSSDRGLAPRALADISAAIEAGRFTLQSAEQGLYMAGGTLLGLLQLLTDDASLDDAALTDDTTQRILVMFGLGKAEARKLCSRPLAGADVDIILA